MNDYGCQYAGKNEVVAVAKQLLNGNKDGFAIFQSGAKLYTIEIASEKVKKGVRGFLNRCFGLNLVDRSVTVALKYNNAEVSKKQYKFSGKKDFRKKIRQAYDESKKANFKAILGNLEKITTAQGLWDALNDKIFACRTYNKQSFDLKTKNAINVYISKNKNIQLSDFGVYSNLVIGNNLDKKTREDICKKKSELEKQIYADAKKYLQTLKKVSEKLSKNMKDKLDKAQNAISSKKTKEKNHEEIKKGLSEAVSKLPEAQKEAERIPQMGKGKYCLSESGSKANDLEAECEKFKNKYNELETFCKHIDYVLEYQQLPQQQK
ncbi:MAG: hypothetical protein LBI81_03460 [Puniceicoccales bacterium]|nr:hypothetical protein [Puniceicoccales bacterium]